MITLPRPVAAALHAVFRRLAPGPPEPAVDLAAGPGGLSAAAAAGGVAVLFFRPGARPPARLRVPVAALAPPPGPGAGPVALAPGPGGGVRADWGAPAGVRVFPPPPPAGPVPAPPGRWAPAPPGLLRALAAAARVAGGAPGGWVRLAGPDRAVAAAGPGGRLVWGGLPLPWPDAPAVPPAGAFRPLARLRPGPAAVARTPGVVWVAAGPWAVALAAGPGGPAPPPAPPPAPGDAVLALHPADAAALRAALRGLPGPAGDPPVALELSARPAARAGGGAGRVVTLPLRRSRAAGPAVAVVTARRPLALALALGCRAVRVSAPGGPVVAAAGPRVLAWEPAARGTALAPPAGHPAGGPDAALRAGLRDLAARARWLLGSAPG